jgi:hypothetical protein
MLTIAKRKKFLGRLGILRMRSAENMSQIAASLLNLPIFLQHFLVLEMGPVAPADNLSSQSRSGSQSSWEHRIRSREIMFAFRLSNVSVLHGLEHALHYRRMSSTLELIV